jgi:hypothetical protein
MTLVAEIICPTKHTILRITSKDYSAVNWSHELETGSLITMLSYDFYVFLDVELHKAHYLSGHGK